MSAIAGRVLILPKGDYDASVRYEFLDLVNHNSSSWLAKKVSQGVEPSDANSEFWQKFGSSVTPDGVTIVIDENGVISAVGGTAENVTYENESVLDVTNVKEALDGIFDGSVAVGDSAKLGDKDASEYVTEEELSVFGTNVVEVLRQAGWYRVAHYKVSGGGAAMGADTQVLDLKILRGFNDDSNELHLIRMNAVYGQITFLPMLDKSNVHLFTKIRYVYTSEFDCYIEVYYSADRVNACGFEISNGRTFSRAWKAITPTHTEETVSGVTVVSTYDIPANSSPLTTGNRPVGTYTGNGSSAHRVIETGNIRDAYIITTDNYMSFIVSGEGFAMDINNTITRFGSATFSAFDGKILLTTTASYLNESGKVYKYWSL